MKKAEFKSSSFVIVLVLFLGGMIWFGAMTANIVASYGNEEVDGFDEFNELNNDWEDAVETMVGTQQEESYDASEDDQYEDRNYKEGTTILNKIAGFTKNIINKGVGAVKVGISTLTSFSRGINILGEQSHYGISIPPQVKYTIYLLIGLGLTFALASAKLRWKI